MTKPKWCKNRLLVGIFSCLLLSGLLRIGMTGVAIANADTDSQTANATTTDFETHSAELSRLIERINQRTQELDEREAKLKEFQTKIDQSRIEIRQELAKLEAAENSLLETIVRVDTAAESDVMALTKVYESMKPKEAALLFEQMTPEFAAGFLAEMPSGSAAGIMSGLTSEKAYAISVVLAGRNTSPE